MAKITKSAKRIQRRSVSNLTTRSSRNKTSIIAKAANKPEWQMTAVEKMLMVRDGVSKKDLENLKSKTNLDYDKLSVLLSTTRATLINKKGTELFSPKIHNSGGLN